MTKNISIILLLSILSMIILVQGYAPEGRNFYKILGVSKNADDKAIKKAYRWVVVVVVSISTSY